MNKNTYTNQNWKSINLQSTKIRKMNLYEPKMKKC